MIWITPAQPGSGNAIGRAGVYLAIGNPQSPAFKLAAATCGLRLP